MWKLSIRAKSTHYLGTVEKLLAGDKGRRYAVQCDVDVEGLLTYDPSVTLIPSGDLSKTSSGSFCRRHQVDR
jgi:hypothetical protein